MKIVTRCLSTPPSINKDDTVNSPKEKSPKLLSTNKRTRKMRVCLNIPSFHPYLSSNNVGINNQTNEVVQNGEIILQSPTNPLEEQDEDIHLAPVAEVLEFLYIGNERDAANKDIIDSLAITHVLNVTAHLPEHFKSSGIIYKRLPANDSSQQDLMKYFDQAFEFIESARKNNGKVLIHCQAGVSRSATVTISYILRKSHLNAYEGYKFVKSKRPVVSPNLNFMGQLMSFEQALNKGEVERKLEPNLKLEMPDQI